MKSYKNFDLTNYNSYRIVASCKEVFFPNTEEEVIDCFVNNENLILLGSGHNIILSKEFYENKFIVFNGNFNNIIVSNDIIEAESGAWMGDLSQIALDNSLTGLEMFYDIPSSLGGAVVMNAGASGQEIKDFLIKVKYLDLADGVVKVMHKDEMSFEYRNSFFQKNTNKIVLKAWLKLEKFDKEKIAFKMESLKANRWGKQPKAFPNGGSVFKRPEGYFVGAIIDDLNLKGYTVGGAKISNKHGGFIINYENATGSDILNIIYHVKNLVYEKLGVTLEVEQRII